MSLRACCRAAPLVAGPSTRRWANQRRDVSFAQSLKRWWRSKTSDPPAPSELEKPSYPGAPVSTSSFVPESPKTHKSVPPKPPPSPSRSPIAKQSMLAADAALMAKLEERSGGGLNAVELEDGKPVGLRKNVKANIFRLI